MSVKVFISYSSVDRAEALTVRRLLVNRGCTVWLDVFDIRVGENLKRELGDGIANADALCLLLSPTAVASRWVGEEIARGLEQEASRGMRFVTVLLRPCRPPDSLTGKVMLDASAGVTSPDVSARLARIILGEEVVGDLEIDAAVMEALQARQHELEEAFQLPELAEELDAVRDMPIRKLKISFRPEALAPGKVIALALTFDRLFSQPMWFLFAHYREGRTWPQWLTNMHERDHREIRSDGKRIDARFEWFDHIQILDPQLDGTDLRDLPATFPLEFSGESWRPGGSIATYAGGPTVPHLAQTMEVPPLRTLIDKGASFALALLGEEEGSQEEIPLERNDLDVRVVAMVGDRPITLFRSAHGPIERAVLSGQFLQTRASAIEREAILGLYRRPMEVATAEGERRRQAAYALLDKPEDELSPDERRVVGLLRYGRAQLEMFRVYGSSPPPGPARERLHLSALGECMAVCRILGPIAAADPRIDDVGMTFWAASNLANYYLRGGVADRAIPYAEYAVNLVHEAAIKDAEESEYRRWQASGLVRLAEALAAAGDHPAAMEQLDGSVEIMQALYRSLPTEWRLRDLRESVGEALRLSEPWPALESSRRRKWLELSDTFAREHSS